MQVARALVPAQAGRQDAFLLADLGPQRVQLGEVASLSIEDGPNQISRDDGRRRIVISANAQGRALSDVVADIRAVVDGTRLPDAATLRQQGTSVLDYLTNACLASLKNAHAPPLLPPLPLQA